MMQLIITLDWHRFFLNEGYWWTFLVHIYSNLHEAERWYKLSFICDGLKDADFFKDLGIDVAEVGAGKAQKRELKDINNQLTRQNTIKQNHKKHTRTKLGNKPERLTEEPGMLWMIRLETAETNELCTRDRCEWRCEVTELKETDGTENTRELKNNKKQRLNILTKPKTVNTMLVKILSHPGHGQTIKINKAKQLDFYLEAEDVSRPIR